MPKKDTSMLQRMKIWFWKSYAIIFDLRPRIHIPHYTDYPIAKCNISDHYEYPIGIKVLFEWDEKGHHWIVFTR